MIFAKRKDAAYYRGICPGLDLALEHLTPDFLRQVGQERVELDGDRVYATRFCYDTLPLEDTFFEAHQRYLDIHLITEGRERIDLAHPDRLERFNQKDDFYGYRGEGEQTVVLTPEDFLVVFPGDAHRIKMQAEGPEQVSKVVFKILFQE